MYADDTTLYAKLSSFGPFPSDEINTEIIGINNWLKINKLSLNVSKTNFMVFHKPQRKVQAPLITLIGETLEKCSTFNFLGIKINESLTWSDHTKLVSVKISRTLGQLKCLKNFVPPRVLQTLYQTLILPHLTYGILIWGVNANELLRQQKKAIRVVTNSRFNAHTQPLMKKYELLNVTDLFKLRQLNFYYRLRNHMLPPYFDRFDFTHNHALHTYNTRRRQVVLPRVKHTFAKNCLNYRLKLLLNETPAAILEKITTHSLKGFSNYVKNHYLNEYVTHCEQHNCYTCRNAH
jgi:hypothetical protein